MGSLSKLFIFMCLCVCLCNSVLGEAINLTETHNLDLPQSDSSNYRHGAVIYPNSNLTLERYTFENGATKSTNCYVYNPSDTLIYSGSVTNSQCFPNENLTEGLRYI